MPRKITQKRKFKGGASSSKRQTQGSSPKGPGRATSRKRTARTARTASPISQVVTAPGKMFKKANQKVENAYEGDLSQECLNILDIQRQEILHFLKDLEDKLKELDVNKRIEVRELQRIIEVNETFVKEATKRKKEWKPAEIALKLSEYIGEKINYDPIIEVIRKFLREQGEPLRRGLYKNSQEMAEKKLYESKPPEANVGNTAPGMVNRNARNELGRPEWLVKEGVYAKTPLTKKSGQPRRELVLSSTSYENENV